MTNPKDALEWLERKAERERNMTNEEWFCSLSTEEKAEWLGDKLDYCQIMWYWACDKCTWSKKHESCMNDKEKWLEWLNQPHKE